MHELQSALPKSPRGHKEPLPPDGVGRVCKRLPIAPCPFLTSREGDARLPPLSRNLSSIRSECRESTDCGPRRSSPTGGGGASGSKERAGRVASREAAGWWRGTGDHRPRQTARTPPPCFAWSPSPCRGGSAKSASTPKPTPPSNRPVLRHPAVPAFVPLFHPEDKSGRGSACMTAFCPETSPRSALPRRRPRRLFRQTQIRVFSAVRSPNFI